MGYIALYRKYRPTKFSEIIGQDLIVKILKNSIENNKIGHAYLFSGPRGTGKTSAAKIFAKTVNCSSPIEGDCCGKCETCNEIEKNDIDIIEIDAASNNGVDEIREIRNNAKLMPSVLKYKVYIIDEVHMLSSGAFNALLKTLEEPPGHVIFILATTEIHKIPLTILSRCQRFDFCKISYEYLNSQLSAISKKEKISITKEAISLISELSDGGFRDAINMLDQLSGLTSEKIAVEDVYSVSGEVSNDTIFNLLSTIINGEAKEGLNIIDNLYKDGKNFNIISERLLLIIRDISIYNNTHDYFNKEYSKKLEKFANFDSEIANDMSRILIEMLKSMKSSSNQKIQFEINYLYLIDKTNKRDKELQEVKETIKEVIEEIVEEKTEILENEETSTLSDVNMDLMNVRINNTFCAADKNLKKDFQKKIEVIEEYLSNIEFNIVASLISSSEVGVVSSDHAVFVFDKVSDVSLYIKNIKAAEKLVEEVMQKKYITSAISKNNWQEETRKYIKNIKDGIKYEYMEETNEVEIQNEDRKTRTALEKTTYELFGEDLIKIT